MLIVKLAENNPVLSVRATAFLCLNYISKTCTGANLIGKIGWHTFQPNIAIQNKAFYSVLSSFTSEQLDLNNFYSSLDIATVLYNINRSKASMSLKNIMIDLNQNQLSTEEKQFLDRQNSIDLMTKENSYFIKSEQNLIKIGFFHENVSIPMQVYLMSPEFSYKSALKTNTKNEFFPYQNGCNVKNCLSCSLIVQETTKTDTDPIKIQIIELIDQYLIMTQLFNVEKTRSSLLKLKLAHMNKFDMCLHHLIVKQLLATRKVKFHFRKFIQELFFDMPLDIFLDSF